ncbi:hypothetical protein MN608_03501 [Microdochium nivale]|nr:hypothetical protein MN608_03501 [Microdochium nivale]
MGSYLIRSNSACGAAAGGFVGPQGYCGWRCLAQAAACLSTRYSPATTTAISPEAVNNFPSPGFLDAHTIQTRIITTILLAGTTTISPLPLKTTACDYLNSNYSEPSRPTLDKDPGIPDLLH